MLHPVLGPAPRYLLLPVATDQEVSDMMMRINEVMIVMLVNYRRHLKWAIYLTALLAVLYLQNLQ